MLPPSPPPNETFPKTLRFETCIFHNTKQRIVHNVTDFYSIAPMRWLINLKTIWNISKSWQNDGLVRDFKIKVRNYFEEQWNESGFRPPLCTYRLNWARSTSWGWRDDWDDTVLQTQDSKYKAMAVWGRARYLSVMEAPHNTELSHVDGEENNFVSYKPPWPGIDTPDFKMKSSGANHYPRAPAHFEEQNHTQHKMDKWRCGRH